MASVLGPLPKGPWMETRLRYACTHSGLASPLPRSLPHIAQQNEGKKQKRAKGNKTRIDKETSNKTKEKGTKNDKKQGNRNKKEQGDRKGMRWIEKGNKLGKREKPP